VHRLRAAGAVIVGKLSLHEFAYGGTTQNAHHGNCRNPWDLARIPGGSSGGSGAALAADFCAAALGTDTGGSVRSPAALNGVTALRPTLGRISSAGLFPITWSFDTVGPMARSVSDVAAVYEVLAGLDPTDPRSVEAYHAARGDVTVVDPSRMRIGLPANFYFDEVSPEIVELVRRAAAVLEDLGCTVDEVPIPGAADAEQATRRIIWAEALAIHADRLATNPDLFGADVRRRLSSGEKVSGPQYARDVQTGREWRLALTSVFDRFDVVLTPTAGVVAPLAAETEMIETTRVMTRLTYGWTLGAVPVLALPCGFSSTGLPVGLQLIGRPWAERTLLALGAAYQQETRWHVQVAPLDLEPPPSAPGAAG
jgi:aspartyl-tRNA(Asn)/glutamyl-tRNA(Gln) amidotransferase subunit A